MCVDFYPTVSNQLCKLFLNYKGLLVLPLHTNKILGFLASSGYKEGFPFFQKKVTTSRIWTFKLYFGEAASIWIKNFGRHWREWIECALLLWGPQLWPLAQNNTLKTQFCNLSVFIFFNASRGSRSVEWSLQFQLHFSRKILGEILAWNSKFCKNSPGKCERCKISSPLLSFFLSTDQY